MTKIVLFGLLCAVTLVVAAFSHDERKVTTLTAVVLSLNWLVFVMPWVYSPWSLAFLAYSVGLPLTQEQGWAFADLASLCMICLIAKHCWWAPLLVAPYMAMLSMYVVAWASQLEYIEYSFILDLSFLVQLASLLIVGGGGVRDRLLGYWRSCVQAGLPLMVAHLAGRTR